MPLSFLSTMLGMVGRSMDSKDAWNTNQYNKKFARDEAVKNRDFQREERLAAQEFDLDMWNRNNEYNSPANQLKLMKEAGINPNSLNGNSFVASSPVTTTPMSGTPTAMPSDASGAFLGRTPNMLSSISSFINNFSQALNTGVKSAWDLKTFEDRAKQVSESTREIESRYHLTDAQTEQVNELNNWVSRKSRAELDLMLAELNNKKEEFNLIKAQTDTEKERKELVDAQTYTEISRDGLLEEQIAGQETSNERSLLAKEQEELKSKFSKITGIPYDSDEFKLAYYLWSQDEFEDYIYFILSKGATDNGSGILKDVMEFFGKVKNHKNPKMNGKRTTTESYGPKGRTFTTSTTIPL